MYASHTFGVGVSLLVTMMKAVEWLTILECLLQFLSGILSRSTPASVTRDKTSSFDVLAQDTNGDRINILYYCYL